MRVKKYMYLIILLFLFKIFFCNGHGYKDFLNLAKQMQNKGDMAGAIEHYKKALEVYPGCFDASFSLGFLFSRQGNFDNSLTFFRKAALVKSDDIATLFNIACILFNKKYQIKEVVPIFEKIATLQPDNKKIHDALYECYLKLGEFEKVRVEKAIRTRLNQNRADQKLFKEWDGSLDLQGKTILIKDDIGIGDLFLWIRYARLFKKRGAYVILQARRALRPLLSKCGLIDLFVARDHEFTDFDFQTTTGRMHHLINKTIDDMYIESEPAYIKVDDVLVQKWKKELSSYTAGVKIGICWDPRPYFDDITKKRVKNNRAISLSCFYQLSKIPGVSLYSLQQRNGIEQLDNMPKDFKIHIFDENFDKTNGRFVDTAAVMKNLDFVITVDTSVAHLAGALGVPVWVMLPLRADWRWLLDRDDTPWYPTMKLFRLNIGEAWENLMNKVTKTLKKVVQKGKV